MQASHERAAPRRLARSVFDQLARRQLAAQHQQAELRVAAGDLPQVQLRDGQTLTLRAAAPSVQSGTPSVGRHAARAALTRPPPTVSDLRMVWSAAISVSTASSGPSKSKLFCRRPYRQHPAARRRARSPRIAPGAGSRATCSCVGVSATSGERDEAARARACACAATHWSEYAMATEPSVTVPAAEW
jgi:hypothetical protein